MESNRREAEKMRKRREGGYVCTAPRSFTLLEYLQKKV
jgi:hypothetical protein